MIISRKVRDIDVGMKCRFDIKMESDSKLYPPRWCLGLAAEDPTGSTASRASYVLNKKKQDQLNALQENLPLPPRSVANNGMAAGQSDTAEVYKPR